MSTWTLNTAKDRLNIAAADTTHDVMIQAALDVALKTVELKLSRKLLLRRETISFPMHDLGYIWTDRYPIQKVYSLSGQTHTMRNYTVFPDQGRIYVGGRGDFTLDYDGGYVELPPDLDYVMWAAFDTIYKQMLNPAAGGATVVQGSGEVQSITIQDLGTVRFDVGAKSVGGIGQVSNDPSYWDWLAPWASVLKLYMHPKAMID
jgi:hypothetical protein